MPHPKQFEKAGKEPGLQIWRVVNMELQEIPPNQHGQFFSGDSYVMLRTYGDLEPKSRYKAFSWIGKKTSVDERGCAAIFLVQLDGYLDGSATLYTEFQDDESRDFEALFPRGIQVKKGGAKSGLRKKDEKPSPCLLHMKGRKHIRAKERDLSWSSFNSGDCFLIDMDMKLYHWAGKYCNPFERLKTTELAIEIRDNERAGNPEIIFVDEGDEPEEITELLGPKPPLPEKSTDDTHIDQQNRNVATLYRVSDAAGKMKTTLVAERNPFRQDMLNDGDCFILDNQANNGILIWKGSGASKEERGAALHVADKFIAEKNYPKNTKISVMPAHAETGTFKQFFFNWIDKYETTGPSAPYIIGKIAKVKRTPFDASTLHKDKAMAAQHCMVDDGSGEVKIWRVEGGGKVPVDRSAYGQFYGGDCYLVQYSYSDGGGTKHIIYIWQGQKSSQDERGASAILAVSLDDSMGGVATQVRVSQGQEPAHLVSVFKKPLIIHLGGTSRQGGDTTPASTRLYHIRRSSTNATRAVEVPADASYLNTNDVFVLKTPGALYQWVGIGATEEELEAAEYVCKLLGEKVTKMDEKKETSAFWNALGGKKEYQTSKALQDAVYPPRLFICSNATGNLIAEEVTGEFTQMDLNPNDVMILDCREEIYIWIGKDANEAEKIGAPKIAEDYLRYDPSGRIGIPIMTIRQGEEPPTFTGWFQAWDPNMWSMSVMELMQQHIKKH